MVGSEQTIHAMLVDASSDHPGIQPVKIVATAFGVELLADGHGNYGTEPGHGSSLFVELFQGRLRLLVWGDINLEEPTHIIDLSGAREDRRNET